MMGQQIGQGRRISAGLSGLHRGPKRDARRLQIGECDQIDPGTAERQRIDRAAVRPVVPQCRSVPVTTNRSPLTA